MRSTIRCAVFASYRTLLASLGSAGRGRGCVQVVSQLGVLFSLFGHNKCSDPVVGRTHTIVRLQTRIRRKVGTEIFWGFVYVLDFYNGILCCGFLCARLISVSLFRLPRRGPPRPTDTPRAITPSPLLHGYHACVHIPAITP